MNTAALSSPLKQLRSLPAGKFETDSRKVEAGDVFVCRQGLTWDSHDFAEDAVKRGAGGLITNKAISSSVPCVETADFSVTVSLINQYYQYPQDKLFNIGVTGTNGKTTVAHSLKTLLDRHFTASYTGTLGCLFTGHEGALINTTPDAITLLNLMHRMHQSGVSHHVMEVSSHALDQDRVSMIDFDLIIFTNLGEDHLDYHGSRTEYVQSKLRLVDRLKPGGKAVINMDDPVAPAIIDRCRGRAEIITFGFRSDNASLSASDVSSSCSGGQFLLSYDGATRQVKTPLPFTFNIENSLAILATLNAIHDDMELAIQLLEYLEPVPGRSEVSLLANGATAIVDYAHNRDSLENLLNNAREHTVGRVITVMGVTGDRLADAPGIGEICSRLSDVAYFTCDNPLGVKPEIIIQAMLRQADSSICHVELDRSLAIRRAVAEMTGDDVLLVCGKGHEQHQYMGPDKGRPEPYIGDSEAVRIAAAHSFRTES